MELVTPSSFSIEPTNERVSYYLYPIIFSSSTKRIPHSILQISMCPQYIHAQLSDAKVLFLFEQACVSPKEGEGLRLRLQMLFDIAIPSTS